MSEPNQSSSSPDEIAPPPGAPAAETPQPEEAPVPAPPATPAPPPVESARGARMWPASTVIAAGVATVLFSGLVGGFIGAALANGGDHGHQDRFSAVRDGHGFRPGPGGMMDGDRGQGSFGGGPYGGQSTTPGGTVG